MTRELSWAGCVNLRDLGGVPTEGGGKTRDPELREEFAGYLRDAGLTDEQIDSLRRRLAAA